MRQIHQRADQRQRLHPQRVLFVDCGEQRFGVTFEQVAEQAALRALVRQPQHIAHPRGSDLALPIQISMGNRLIEDRKPIANRPLSCRSDDP